ncbi:MAG: type II toxin-antitoxin system RelE/ParE family toxin [Gammaproteobacteria bacterium]|nr:type II toxin-antitoxin system RelE/ParE family toxin [Gammaproteobacteria bacterium]MDE0035934.1 type II toxin-antitoxin system RelE/ParE family toxin [Gammaproteobacteria bacterium]MDE0443388.1 type II toxin-antitoxin system RelE/ParE family toxin [Gammaproteobacteria bacterium]
MIQGFANRRARALAAGRTPRGFPPDLVRRARAMLTAMNAATRLQDLRFPPGNHLEKLAGDREGQHSVRINRQWRICFVWTRNGPEKVEVVDYH